MQENVANLQYQREWTVWANLDFVPIKGAIIGVVNPKTFYSTEGADSRERAECDSHWHRTTRVMSIVCAFVCVDKFVGVLCGTYQNTKVTNISYGQRNGRNSWTVNWCTFVMATFAQLLPRYITYRAAQYNLCYAKTQNIAFNYLCGKVRDSSLRAELLTIVIMWLLCSASMISCSLSGVWPWWKEEKEEAVNNIDSSREMHSFFLLPLW